MQYSAINFKQKFSKIDDHWIPRVIAEMNEYQFKIVKIQGEFIWHDHADTDEVFIVLEGVLDIEFRDGNVTIQSGEMFVVPKGVEHKPASKLETRILVIEPRGVINTGDRGGKFTAENDVWI